MFFFLYTNSVLSFFFFFFNDTATTEIYTLSLHDALPISTIDTGTRVGRFMLQEIGGHVWPKFGETSWLRSEEHTSELQSLAYLVCRLLLEKKKKQRIKEKNYKSDQLPYSTRCSINSTNTR